MIKRILAYFLFASGLLSVTFFRASHSELLPNQWLFWLIGAVLFTAGWALLRYTPTVRQEHEKVEHKKKLIDLKTHGEKVHVLFSRCKLKSNDFTQEQELFSDDVVDIPLETQAWDEPMSTKLIEVHETVVLYTHKYMGREETFVSDIILKDPATLMFLLDEKKETYIYVDPGNRSRYYFDLDFLNTATEASE